MRGEIVDVEDGRVVEEHVVGLEEDALGRLRARGLRAHLRVPVREVGGPGQGRVRIDEVERKVARRELGRALAAVLRRLGAARRVVAAVGLDEVGVLEQLVRRPRVLEEHRRARRAVRGAPPRTRPRRRRRRRPRARPPRSRPRSRPRRRPRPSRARCRSTPRPRARSTTAPGTAARRAPRARAAAPARRREQRDRADDDRRGRPSPARAPRGKEDEPPFSHTNDTRVLDFSCDRCRAASIVHRHPRTGLKNWRKQARHSRVIGASGVWW